MSLTAKRRAVHTCGTITGEVLQVSNSPFHNLVFYKSILTKCTNSGIWTRNAISISGLTAPTATGLRGKFAVANSGELIALIPSNTDTSVMIYYSTAGGSFKDWKQLWKGTGFDTEPLFDKQRLKDQNILSVFFRQSGSYPNRRLQVIDFALGS